MNRGCPQNIKIHDLGLDCYGKLREKRYGTPGTRGFDGEFVDGIHMRGFLAVTHYTDSVIRMFRLSAANCQAGRSQTRSDYHANCEQAVYQRRQGQYGSSHGSDNTYQQNGYKKQTNRGFYRNNGNQYANNWSGYQNTDYVGNQRKNTFTIPLNNRFSGNFYGGLHPLLLMKTMMISL